MNNTHISYSRIVRSEWAIRLSGPASTHCIIERRSVGVGYHVKVSTYRKIKVFMCRIERVLPSIFVVAISRAQKAGLGLGPVCTSRGSCQGFQCIDYLSIISPTITPRNVAETHKYARRRDYKKGKRVNTSRNDSSSILTSSRACVRNSFIMHPGTT